jgi:hypothetical protein
MCVPILVDLVNVNVVAGPRVGAPDICPEFAVCPKYQFDNQVFTIGRTAAELEYDSTIVGSGGTPVNLRCKRRQRPSNANGDPLGSWSVWEFVHFNYTDDHHFPVGVPQRHHVLFGVTQGTWWLTQMLVTENVTPFEWETHPNCGDSAWLILTATFTEGGEVRMVGI